MGGWWMSVRASTIAIALIGLAEALAVPASTQLQGQTIRIAIGAPLTGGAATFGVEMKQAVELASQSRTPVAASWVGGSKHGWLMTKQTTRRAWRWHAGSARTRASWASWGT